MGRVAEKEVTEERASWGPHEDGWRRRMGGRIPVVMAEVDGGVMRMTQEMQGTVGEEAQLIMVCTLHLQTNTQGGIQHHDSSKNQINSSIR